VYGRDARRARIGVDKTRSSRYTRANVPLSLPPVSVAIAEMR
jgi:hypothetical protein